MDLTAPRAAAPDGAPTDKAGAGLLPLRLEGVVLEKAGRRLIDDVSLTLEAGPRTVILGPNGAGKSLTLRLCHGLLQPTAGHIAWAAAGSAQAIQNRQAMVFQKPVLMRRTVAANVDYGLALRGIGRRHRREIVDDVLNRTGLARFADQPARLLSGGEQQKLALARAWALRPQILFLDEPTASLDPAATFGVESIVMAMHAEGTRIVMTTHDLGQAKRIADEVVFLHKGRLLEKTPARSFFDAPQSGEAAAFLRGELRW